MIISRKTVSFIFMIFVLASYPVGNTTADSTQKMRVKLAQLHRIYQVQALILVLQLRRRSLSRVLERKVSIKVVVQLITRRLPVLIKQLVLTKQIKIIFGRL